MVCNCIINTNMYMFQSSELSYHRFVLWVKIYSVGGLFSMVMIHIHFWSSGWENLFLVVLKRPAWNVCWKSLAKTLKLPCKSAHLDTLCTVIITSVFQCILLKQQWAGVSVSPFSVHQEFKLVSLNIKPCLKCFSRICLSCKTWGKSFGLFSSKNRVHLNNSQQSISRGKS